MKAIPLPSQQDFSSALLDPCLPCPAGLRAWNGSDPAARFAVHRNNVVGSLIDALADNFPVVQQLVGEEFFRAMAGLYVRRAPPESPVLAFYGAGFPSFIAEFDPARGLPYLADMARLEAARVQAYHAADAEQASADSVALALASGERIGELRLECHPSLRTLSSAWSVVSLWAAHQGAEFEALEVDRPECALVVRLDLEVLVLPAPAATDVFVAALGQARSLGDAAGAAGADFDLAGALSLLLRHGAISSILLPRRLDS
ncbi:MAG: putative DNA-binding domain-containing protein [Burkholderiales bacterium]|nr:putative DNA-binding domain-containing protein [Burkholderiales bacterium]MDE2397383.1 putative DNA-binding domain-containing protein [Burkholderiales bacterium]MDE2453649.1 putative DNA-binding domain-containing protein [Burkholderiales bacterium]